MSLPRIVVSESSLLPTPLASDMNREHQHRKDGTNLTLLGAVKLWATPNAVDCLEFVKKDLSDKTTKNGFQGGRKNLREEVLARPAVMAQEHPDQILESSAEAPTPSSGSLNPTWVEWLMGFPTGWTDLDHSETP